MDNRDKIKTLLKEKRMSVRELASRCGVAHTTIYRYLNGYTPTIKNELLEQIAKVFNVPTHIFFEDEAVRLDVQLKADFIKSELVRMQITDQEYDKLMDYILYLQSSRK